MIIKLLGHILEVHSN